LGIILAEPIKMLDPVSHFFREKKKQLKCPHEYSHKADKAVDIASMKNINCIFCSLYDKMYNTSEYLQYFSKLIHAENSRLFSISFCWQLRVKKGFFFCHCAAYNGIQIRGYLMLFENSDISTVLKKSLHFLRQSWP
jgi:hypothetical protein